MANKSKKDGCQKYDWNKIKRDYCTHANMSLRDISKKYGVRLQTVAKHSKAENWFATKKETQTKIGTKAITKAAEIRADQLANEMMATDLLSEHLLRALSDPEQFNRYIVQETESYQDGTMKSETVEKTFSKVDARALKDIASALKSIEEMKRGLYNIMKADALNKDRREEEKLQIEKDRFELEKQKHETAKVDDSIKVVIAGYEEGWEG